MRPEVRWFLAELKPFWGLQVTRLCAIVLASGLMLVDPLIFKWIIDDILLWKKHHLLLVAVGIFLVVYTFRLCFNGIAAMLDYYTTQRLTLNMRARLLRHLQSQSPRFFVQRKTGDLLHRIEQDVSNIAMVGGAVIASFFRLAITSVLAVAIMMILSWKLTLAILPLIPVLALLRRYGGPRIRSASDVILAHSGDRTSFVQERLNHMFQIQLLNREASDRLRFFRIQRRVFSAEMDRRGLEVGLRLSSVGVTAVATAIVFGYGGYQVLLGALTVGSLVAFFTYLNRLFEPVETVVQLYTMVERSGASIRRLLEIQEEGAEVEDPPDGIELPAGSEGSVEIVGVHFSYRPGEPVLRGLDLKIEAGERIALVGSSGSGKSTLASLLPRLMNVDEGGIWIGGLPVERIRLKSLRSRVSLVPQEAPLFDATLRENLVLGSDGGVSDETLDHALQVADLDSVFPAGAERWDSPLGSKGARLSGGQRQRVAIARAFLQDPGILVLDEATSALDGPTERRVLERLDLALSGRTIVLIAHRLSAILWARRIVVLDRGRVVEDGSHEALYRQGGLYRRLHDEQLSRETPAPASKTPRLEPVP